MYGLRAALFHRCRNPVFSQTWARLACVPCVQAWRVMKSRASQKTVHKTSQSASQLKILEPKTTRLSERKLLLSCCHWMIGSGERVRVAVWGILKVGAQIDFRLHTLVILCFKANIDSLLEVQIILFEVRSPTCSLRYINTDFQWVDGHGIRYNGFYIIANNVISEVTCMHFKWSSPGPRKGLCNDRELRYIGSRPVLRFYILFPDQLKHTHTHTMVWVCLCVFQVGGGGGGGLGGWWGGGTLHVIISPLRNQAWFIDIRSSEQCSRFMHNLSSLFFFFFCSGSKWSLACVCFWEVRVWQMKNVSAVAQEILNSPFFFLNFAHRRKFSLLLWGHKMPQRFSPTL